VASGTRNTIRSRNNRVRDVGPGPVKSNIDERVRRALRDRPALIIRVALWPRPCKEHPYYVIHYPVRVHSRRSPLTRGIGEAVRAAGPAKRATNRIFDR